MKKGLFILILFLYSFESNSQERSLMFQKSWGDPYGNLLTYADELANGDYILIGRCALFVTPMFSSGPFQFYACRIDKSGNLIWEKNFGDPNEEDYISSVIKTREGTYAISGTSFYISDYFPSLLNIDADGNELFLKIYNTTYTSGAASLSETTDSGFMLTGNIQIPPVGQSVPLLIRVDQNGNELWQKRQDTLTDYYPGIIATCPDGGFLVEGMYYSSYTAQWTMKYDLNGNAQWLKYPCGDSVCDRIRGIFVNADGMYEIPIVERDTLLHTSDTHMKKYDVNGNEAEDRLLVKNFALNFTSLFNCGVQSYGIDSTLISTASPYSFGAQYIMSLKTNDQVLFRAKLSGVDSTNNYLMYSIATSDGGILSVGDNGSDPTRFYVVKFGPDGRYQANEFIESVGAYPVPSNDGNVTLTFDMQKDENLDVRVLSSDGRLVYNTSIFVPANSHTELPVRLDIASSAAGMYILEARTEDAVYRKKLVVN